MKKIGKLAIRRTGKIFNKNSRMATLVYGPPKIGKTSYGARLHRLTEKYLNKPTLIIACEAGEGGGTASVQDLDVPYVRPEEWSDMEELLAQLHQDKEFGGVVLDSSTETVKTFLKRWALTFKAIGARDIDRRTKAGVPERSDYQTMGERLRAWFQSLINLTTIGGDDPSSDEIARRKHVIITALERYKYDDEGNLTKIMPDLPGQMADAAAAMFQTVGTIKTQRVPVPGTKPPKFTVETKFFCGRGTKMLGLADRFGLLEDTTDPDPLLQYEKYWLPKIQSQETNDGNESP